MSDDNDIAREFRRLVNLSAAEFRDWLGTAESRAAGWTREGETESIGHQSGRWSLSFLESGASDPEGEGAAHMRKVVGYIHRHLAQRPEGDVSDTRWRHSLMNWGHDPLKEDERMSDEMQQMPEMQDGAMEPATPPMPQEAPKKRRPSPRKPAEAKAAPKRGAAGRTTAAAKGGRASTSTTIATTAAVR